MKFKLQAGIVLLSCTCGASLADQTDDAVFFQQNPQHVFNSVFGVPAPASRIVQGIEWQFSLEHSNQFAGGRTADEVLVIDGESSVFRISHKQRLTACWQAEAVVPLIAYDGGVFDQAIDNFHQFFNTPDGNRDATEFDQLTFQYANANGETHNIVSPQSGIGDVQLTVQRALGCFATADSIKEESIVRLGIKLPTGDPDELRGSGEVDVFADWQSGIKTLRKRWYGAVSLGAAYLGEADDFPDQRRGAVYGSVGTQFAINHRWRFISQLDAHTAFFDSALRELGDTAVNWGVGFRYLAGQSYSLELSISEDIAIDTTPDIVARLALSYRPSFVSRRR